MRLGEKLPKILAIELEKEQQEKLRLAKDKDARYAKEAEEQIQRIIPVLEKRAREGLRWGTIQRPVKTNAKWWPPGTTSNKNVCTPDDLIAESSILYHRCVDELGLNVVIRFWIEELGINDYAAGYEMVAVW